MKSNYTHIAVLLDRSGSMSSMKEEVVSGINKLIKEQKEAEGTASMSISQFDDFYDIITEFEDIQTVKDIDSSIYVPRGMTALNDSLAKLIKQVGKKLASMPEEERPEKVLVHVISDGQENASEDRTGEKLKALVKEQEEKYGWCFVYIGANQDSKFEARSKGILNSVNYVASKVGMDSMFNSLSSASTVYRSASIETKKLFNMEDVK